MFKFGVKATLRGFVPICCSLLLLDIEPEGPSYELPMEARVVQPVHRQRTSPSILSSSSFLSFNGVALNQTK